MIKTAKLVKRRTKVLSLNARDVHAKARTLASDSLKTTVHAKLLASEIIDAQKSAENLLSLARNARLRLARGAMKIVINACHGGFGLSHEGIMLYAKLKGIKLYAYVHPRDADGRLDLHSYKEYVPNKDKESVYYSTNPLNSSGRIDEYFHDDKIERNDSALVKVVERLKEKANCWFASLKVVKIPNGIKWEICEYGGEEEIHEKHRKWS